MPSRFEAKKQKILEILRTPDEQYHDLSPKGSVDEAIRPLIADINRLPGLVTTSSCSGRVSVFCEGKKNAGVSTMVEEGEREPVNQGGKGQGKWLFISHDRVPEPKGSGESESLMKKFGLKATDVRKQEGLDAESSYIHLKFEPMVAAPLHPGICREEANRKSRFCICSQPRWKIHSTSSQQL